VPRTHRTPSESRLTGFDVYTMSEEVCTHM
jgi:hypothetical protein